MSLHMTHMALHMTHMPLHMIHMFIHITHMFIHITHMLIHMTHMPILMWYCDLFLFLNFRLVRGELGVYESVMGTDIVAVSDLSHTSAHFLCICFNANFLLSF